MTKKLIIFTLFFTAVFLIDQYIKQIFIDGFRYDGEMISLILVYNKGVAFSMFAFLGEYLKYIQIFILLGVFLYVYFSKELFEKLYYAFGMLLGSGASNVYDRFVHGGVVDYVYWHYGFEFAVFNLADVMIDLAVVIILYVSFFGKKKSSPTA